MHGELIECMFQKWNYSIKKKRRITHLSIKCNSELQVMQQIKTNAIVKLIKPIH